MLWEEAEQWSRPGRQEPRGHEDMLLTASGCPGCGPCVRGATGEKGDILEGWQAASSEQKH